MPFEDNAGDQWFCSHCALIEGALMINYHWADEVEINRISSEKPRNKLVDILGAENQWMPVLIFCEGETLTDSVKITQYLADKFGGGPHLISRVLGCFWS